MIVLLGMESLTTYSVFQEKYEKAFGASERALEAYNKVNKYPKFEKCEYHI